MSTELRPGTRARVRVPASTANLGPGYDTLGLALTLYDVVEVEVTDPHGGVPGTVGADTMGASVRVDITGEGADELPRDESNLVVRAVRSGLKAADVTAPGLKVTCTNAIPQSRGLGSSASAAVAGVAAANALAGSPLSAADLVQLSSEFEGHPDNAAASVLGQAVTSWTSVPVDGRSLPTFRAVQIPVHKDIRATAIVPDFHASTREVRRVLPSHVTHQDAAFNVSRAALQTVALRDHPELLWEGTRDRLHQPYRADVLPVTAEWVNRLRNRGLAAFLSGAGPTVLVLHTEPIPDAELADARAQNLRIMQLGIAGPVEASADFAG